MIQDDIKVIWEDTTENFSEEKLKIVQKYFMNKYQTTRVRVIFNSIRSTKATGVDAGELTGDLVIDTTYQHKLMQAYIKDHKLNDLQWEYLVRFDWSVNNAIEETDAIGQRFKRFTIKKINFSNFLSFSPEKHTFDMSNHNGILTVESIPSNYGGKTVLTVDLLLFLFFNTTTKTNKAEEIFNRYSDHDEVIVNGEIEIDNVNYIIERRIKRVKKRDGSFNTTTSLDFFQVIDGQNIIKLNGEQRAATDKIIKDYIGTKEDFLLTIVTTSQNLEDLIDSKPTERGQILTRFIGIDFFQTKEKIAKKLYADWLLKTKIRTTTKETLLLENEQLERDIVTVNVQLIDENNRLKNIDDELSTKRAEHADVLRSIKPIDKGLYQINEDDLISRLNTQRNSVELKKSSINEQKSQNVKPTTPFNIDEFNGMKSNLVSIRNRETQLINEMTVLSSVMSDLSAFTDCTKCGKLVFTEEATIKIKESQNRVLTIKTELDNLKNKIIKIEETIANVENIRELWSVHDKAVLVIEKSELDLQILQTAIQRDHDLLNEYLKNKELINQNKLHETTINKLQLQIDALETQKMDQRLLIQTLEQDLKRIKNQIEDNKSSVVQIEKELIFQKHFLVYIDMFGKNGIGKMVLSTMIPLINSYLGQILTDVCEFRLILDLNDKNMVEFNMLNVNEDVITPLESGSGFEKTVASIALRCAMSKICSLPKPNIIVFDEVFGKVSNENLERMSNLFDRLKEFFGIIIVISHNPIVHEWGERKLIVMKENNMSKLTFERK